MHKFSLNRRLFEIQTHNVLIAAPRTPPGTVGKHFSLIQRPDTNSKTIKPTAEKPTTYRKKGEKNKNNYTNTIKEAIKIPIKLLGKLKNSHRDDRNQIKPQDSIP